MVKKKVLGYIRVSTEEQVEGYSLDNQKNDIIKLCEYEGWELVDIYEDRGISGSSLKDRKGLQQAAKRIEARDIEFLVVWKVSRLSRRLADVVDIVRLLKDHETYFFAIKDRIDTSTNMGKYFLYIASIFAEIERENLITQVRGGMRQKALEGKWNGQAPFGYKMTDGKLEIEEEKAEIVKRIYKEYYVSSKGYASIVEGLNRDGYKTNKGTAFSNYGVKYILQNPTYAGFVRWGKLEDWGVLNSKGERKRKYSDDVVYVEGIHKAIIDEELFDKVQEKIKNNPRAHMRRFQGHHLLSGILRCEECGYGMSINVKIILYKCANISMYSFASYLY